MVKNVKDIRITDAATKRLVLAEQKRLGYATATKAAAAMIASYDAMTRSKK